MKNGEKVFHVRVILKKKKKQNKNWKSLLDKRNVFEPNVLIWFFFPQSSPPPGGVRTFTEMCEPCL